MKQWNIMQRLIITGLCALPCFLQAATLSVGKDIELLVVDGKDTTPESFNTVNEMELPAGKHQVVVRYDGSFKDGSKNRSYTTKPYLFELDMPAQDAVIVLPKMYSVTQAQKHFKHDPQWNLQLADGESQPLSYVILQGKGFLAYADVEELVADYNLAQAPEILQPAIAKPVRIAVADTTTNTEANADTTAAAAQEAETLLQLKLWYQRATPQERMSFLAWAAAQNL